MVKIQTKKVHKTYKHKKYQYPQHLIPVPMKRNPEIEPFLEKQLDFDIANNEIKIKVKKETKADKDT